MNSRWCVLSFALAPLLAALLVSAGDADEERASARETHFAERILPFLKSHCIRCHGDVEPQGDLSLARYASAEAMLADRITWRKIEENLRLRTMPPEGEPRPPEGEVEAAVHWIKSELDFLDCGGPRDPGRVTLRRLNRVEYNNTIRDLVGVDFAPANDFPADETGNGFDNMGEVLAMSPLLFEKYLSAAEQVAARAIVLPEDALPRRRLEAEKFDRDHGGADGEFASLYSTGGMRGELRTREAGTYRLRIRAFGDQAGDEPARMAVLIDGQEVAAFDVNAERPSPQEYTAEVALKEGRTKIELRFVNDFYQPDFPDPNRRDRNLAVDYVQIEGALEGASARLHDAHRRLIFENPAAGSPFAPTARRLLQSFAARAYRRPIEESELDRLVALVESAEQDGANFERSMQFAVQAVLTSPHFLFRVEIDDQPEGGATAAGAIRSLNSHEMASRLSYFLWSSMPDEPLFALAAEGKLQDPAVLTEQVRRMLADPKSRALVDNFGAQWLTLRSLDVRTPNQRLYPTFDDALRQAMRQETLDFFAGILREDRSALEFIDADYTYLNDRLAEHYGIAGVSGPEFRKVSLTDGRRGGVISQASILTITSNPTRTSPVKRGKWILEQLLGTPAPPPPAGVEELTEDAAKIGAATLRERMEKHREVASCASCHARMDPLGFGLENYNGIGFWRDREGETPVDASGLLPDGTSFNGPAELKRVLLARHEDFSRCLTEKMLAYALGRGLTPADRCYVDEIAAKMASDGHKLSRLIQEVVLSDPFRLRRGQGEMP